MLRLLSALSCLTVFLLGTQASGGPETSIREFGSGQIKKGVRSLGMGGDGATTGNYSLVSRDAGVAIADYGETHYTDSGDAFRFTAVGASTPHFWGDTTLFAIAIDQQAKNVSVWSRNKPTAKKPPAHGDGHSRATFLKMARSVSETVQVGLLLGHEVSSIDLKTDSTGAAVSYKTAWRPSGGAGVTWQPVPWILTGARILAGRDRETRTDAAGSTEGDLASTEYRVGIAVTPWPGTMVDVGVARALRKSSVDQTASGDTSPTVGIEQELVSKTLWLRAGLAETSPTVGASWKCEPVKVDVAYVRNLGYDRIKDVFGKTSNSLVATINIDYL